jgi:DNA-binding NarL/FixJ family response regulator
MDPYIAARVMDEFRRLSQNADTAGNTEQLTAGEMDVLRMVAEGEDNQTIAHNLNLSEQTVANRLRFIYQKLQVNNRTQAAIYALRRGWVAMDSEE